ncbi:hypothetical protein [Bacteroides caecimuris]|uniref:hypothetical protein n=1 Tax=Bacteroides caecimuris TaxID=1796613 RepID=UPI00272A01B3|nr:hypothetical protein [Bacteroides caecimuris]
MDIYIQHGEYIYPPRWIYILTSEPEKLKALPLAYSTFLQGMIFFGFSCCRLPAKRLRIKLKRLKAEIAMRYTLLSYTSIFNGVIHTIYER